MDGVSQAAAGVAWCNADGARIEFHRPLVVGEGVRCKSELSDVKMRSTPAAHLAIATLRHSFFGGTGLAVVEEQDIIHLEPIGGDAKNGAAGEPWR